MKTKRRSKRKKVGKFLDFVFDCIDILEVLWWIVRGIIWVAAKIIKSISH